MGRIIKTIEIAGKPATVLFDTGATFTYVKPSYLAASSRVTVPRPLHVELGGKKIEIRELCFVEGKIEGLGFVTDAVPLEDIGKAEGQELDARVGVLTMERYEIKLDPKSRDLDLDGLRRLEFTEF